METSQFGIVAALTWAVAMFVGAGLNMLWWAKINPRLHKKPTMTFKELRKRIES